MLTPTREQFQAAKAFDLALRRVLWTHGLQWGERLRVTVDARPGALTVVSVNDDRGYEPVLMVGLDEREPGAFGRRLEPSPAGWPAGERR